MTPLATKVAGLIAVMEVGDDDPGVALVMGDDVAIHAALGIAGTQHMSTSATCLKSNSFSSCVCLSSLLEGAPVAQGMNPAASRILHICTVA